MRRLALSAAVLGLASVTLASGASAKQSGPYGHLDREVIRGVVVGHMPEVRACHESGLLTAPDLTGRVEVEFTIAPDGHVSGATLDETSLAPRGAAADAVETCIVVAVLGWTFPAPEGGMLLVNYPFVLEPTLDAGVDAGVDAGAGRRRRRGR